MAEQLYKFAFLALALCVLFSSVLSVDGEENACVEETSCLCRLDDHRYIDISHSITKEKPYLSVVTGKLTYFFFPCQDEKFNYTALGLKVNSTRDNCTLGVSLCLYNAEDESLANLGTTKDTKFSHSVPKLLYYTRNNPNITSTIKLDCTPEDGLTYLELDPNDNGNSKDLHFILFSPSACVRTEEHGISAGSTLLILFSTLFGIYFLGGALVLHFLRGARGTEMIPNLDFWVDLPLLVRDGIVFLLNGCNPISVSTAETYDRI